MPVMERESIVLPPELQNLPEVEYSAEDIERLDKIILITDAQIADGEHTPRTLAEFAAEYGLKANTESYYC